MSGTRGAEPRILKPHSVEETYEVIDAIDSGDPDKLKEELADPFSLFFTAKLQKGKGRIRYRQQEKVMRLDKMTRRHPHVLAMPQPLPLRR